MAIYTSSYTVSASLQTQGFTISSFDPTDAGLSSVLNTSTTSINAGTGLPRTPEEYANIEAFWSSNTSPDNAVASMNAYGVTIGDVTQATGISNQDVIDYLIQDLYWNITAKSSDDINVVKDTLTPVGPLEAVVFGRYDTTSNWYFGTGESNVRVIFRDSAPYTTKTYSLDIRIARSSGPNYIPTGVSFSITFDKTYALASIDPIAYIVLSVYPYQSGVDLDLTSPDIGRPYITHRTFTDPNGFVVGPGSPSPPSGSYPFRWKVPGDSTFAFAGDTIPSLTLTVSPGSQNAFTYEVWTSDETTLIGTYTNYFSASNSGSVVVGPGQSSQGLSIVRDAASALSYPADFEVSFRPGYAVNGLSPYAYYVTPALPTGLSLNSSTGVISGTPVSISSLESYTFTVIDENNADASITFSLTVADPTATYSIIPTVTSVNESGTVEFDVSTVSIPDGTSLYWSISGTNITGSDFSDFVVGPSTGLEGTVVINSNQGSFSKSVRADLELEGPEIFTVQLRTGSSTGPVVATSVPITINDTSTSPIDTPTGTANGTIVNLSNYSGNFAYHYQGEWYKIPGNIINLN